VFGKREGGDRHASSLPVTRTESRTLMQQNSGHAAIYGHGRDQQKKRSVYLFFLSRNLQTTMSTDRTRLPSCRMQ